MTYQTSTIKVTAAPRGRTVATQVAFVDGVRHLNHKLAAELAPKEKS